MSPSADIVILLGGRLAVDFGNAPSYPGAPFNDLSWEEFIGFLEAARIVSTERSDQLLALPETDPRSAHGLLTRATHLRDALRRNLHGPRPARPDRAEMDQADQRCLAHHRGSRRAHRNRRTLETPFRRSRDRPGLAARRHRPLGRRNRARRRCRKGPHLCQSRLRPLFLRQIPHPQASVVLNGYLRQSQQGRQLRPPPHSSCRGGSPGLIDGHGRQPTPIISAAVVATSHTLAARPSTTGRTCARTPIAPPAADANRART